MSLKVSIILPTLRSSHFLQRCLAALVRQDFDPIDYEIIVADDEASIRTRSLVEEWAARAQQERGGPDIRYIPVVKTHGHAAARNAGYKKAKGNILAFTDDDCIPDAKWLRAGVAVFQDEKVLGAWGRLVILAPAQPTKEAQTQRISDSSTNKLPFVTANCFFRKSAVEEVGGFDERFEQTWHEASDLQFAIANAYKHHIEENGWENVFPRINDAVVTHPLMLETENNLFQKNMLEQREAMFDALLHKKHPNLYRQKIHVPTPWQHYAATAALTLAVTSTQSKNPGIRRLGWLAGALWLGFTGQQYRQQNMNSSQQLRAAGSAMQSMIVPPLAVYWRLRGALRFRNFFL